MASIISIDEAPYETADATREFFPESEWNNAVSVWQLESNFDPFALRDTTDADHPCGSLVGFREGVAIYAERSVGVAQINSCNFPGWEWQRFYNVRHNIGTAHVLWIAQGWGAWYFSAKALGLI
jgi:hypothetical protein